MLIARALLAIGALLVSGGVGLGVYGLTQHPSETAMVTLHPGECTAFVLTPSPGGVEPPRLDGDSSEPTALLCQPATDSKGMWDESMKWALESLRSGQRWLVFVAFGILLISLGLAFLTSAAFVSIVTAVSTGRTAASARAGSGAVGPAGNAAQESGDSST
jgi:hypothetical protein